MIFLAGFYGWSDAGMVSTETVRYILSSFNPHLIKEIKGYNVITHTRPYFLIDGGLIKSVKEPSTNFFLCEKKGFIVSIGFEPDLRWGEYVEEIFGLLEANKVNRIFTIGSMYDRVSHRKAQRISIVTSKENLREEPDCGVVNYHGPGSIHSFIIYESRKRNLDATTFWFSVPAYIPNVVYYPAVLSALEFLSRRIGFSINLDDPRRIAKEQLDGLEKQIQIDLNFKKLIEEIEGEKIIVQ